MRWGGPATMLWPRDMFIASGFSKHVWTGVTTAQPDVPSAWRCICIPIRSCFSIAVPAFRLSPTRICTFSHITSCLGGFFWRWRNAVGSFTHSPQSGMSHAFILSLSTIASTHSSFSDRNPAIHDPDGFALRSTWVSPRRNTSLTPTTLFIADSTKMSAPLRYTERYEFSICSWFCQISWLLTNFLVCK